jgi:hypothetical protein
MKSFQLTKKIGLNHNTIFLRKQKKNVVFSSFTFLKIFFFTKKNFAFFEKKKKTLYCKKKVKLTLNSCSTNSGANPPAKGS